LPCPLPGEGYDGFGGYDDLVTLLEEYAGGKKEILYCPSYLRMQSAQIVSLYPNYMGYYYFGWTGDDFASAEYMRVTDTETAWSTLGAGAIQWFSLVPPQDVLVTDKFLWLGASTDVHQPHATPMYNTNGETVKGSLFLLTDGSVKKCAPYQN
jgi:hypothetical protein